MRYAYFAFILILTGFLGSAYAQQPADCPKDLVCISRQAAEKALQDSDTVKAQAAELAVKDKAIADLKDEIDKMRTEYVRASTEASDLKQQQVRDAAIIELLLKYAKPKKFGIINF